MSAPAVFSARAGASRRALWLCALLAFLGWACASRAVEAAPRLSVSGARILGPSGAPILLRGYNWNEHAQKEDAAENAAQGANLVRMTLWWHVDATKTCSGSFPDRKFDAYAPGHPGNLDPTLLAALDSKIAWASSKGLWVDLAIHGGACDFWTDPKITAQLVDMWSFLANRYRDTPRIGFYELLSEPKPRDNKSNNAELKSLYARLITAIRSKDPATPIMIGPAPTYNIRNLSSIYMPNEKNLVYTANFYELNQYVKQSKKGSPVIGGYPGRYGDSRFADTSCNYPGKGGAAVDMDKKWLAGLLGCMTGFRASHQVPVFVNQIGIRSGVPDSLKWAGDVLNLLNADDIGWAYWVYRMRHKGNSQLGAGTAIMWEDEAGGWHSKPDWHGMISAHMGGTASR